MLTSTRNPKVQHIRALQSRARARREAGAFVIEGVRLIEESLAAGLLPRLAIYTEDISPRGQAVLGKIRSLDVKPIPVAPHVMLAASDTKSPQGVLAVLPTTPLPLPQQPNFVIILDGVRDPGNLGAILRTAAAAGVDGALLSPGSVDPHSPKVVRAAMGAHFRLPIHPLPWPEICQQTASLRVYLADTNAPLAYTDADFRTPLALIVGGEAEGVTSEAWKLSPAGVRIPMPGDTESLNAAVAAAVLMFEAIRQRQYTYTDRTPYRQSPQP